MSREGLGPESAPVPGPSCYSPILAFLFRGEKTVIAHLEIKVRERGLAGRVSVAYPIPPSKLPLPAYSDHCLEAQTLFPPKLL